jgi:hypothetical protein
MSRSDESDEPDGHVHDQTQEGCDLVNGRR